MIANVLSVISIAIDAYIVGLIVRDVRRYRARMRALRDKGGAR